MFAQLLRESWLQHLFLSPRQKKYRHFQKRYSSYTPRSSSALSWHLAWVTTLLGLFLLAFAYMTQTPQERLHRAIVLDVSDSYSPAQYQNITDLLERRVLEGLKTDDRITLYALSEKTEDGVVAVFDEVYGRGSNFKILYLEAVQSVNTQTTKRFSPLVEGISKVVPRLRDQGLDKKELWIVSDFLQHSGKSYSDYSVYSNPQFYNFETYLKRFSSLNLPSLTIYPYYVRRSTSDGEHQTERHKLWVADWLDRLTDQHITLSNVADNTL